jgi:hypothetical protein
LGFADFEKGSSTVAIKLYNCGFLLKDATLRKMLLQQRLLQLDVDLAYFYYSSL